MDRAAVKAANAGEIHAATLGRRLQQPARPAAPDSNRLVSQYRRWVHRCVTINAQVAACVPMRLAATGRSAQRIRSLEETERKILGRTHGMKVLSQQKSKLMRRSQMLGTVAKARLGLDDEEVVEITQHPLLTLLQQPNQTDDAFFLLQATYADLQWAGAAYWQFVRPNIAQPPAELWRMLPHLTTPIPDPHEFVSAYAYGRDVTNRQMVDADDVIWFRTFDPDDPWGAMGPLRAWFDTVQVDHAMDQFRLDMFERGGSPDWLLVAEKGMNDAQKRAFRVNWRALFGRLWRRDENVAIVDGKADLKRISDTPRDLEFAVGSQAVRDEVCQGFGVPKALVTTDDVNLANAREGSITHLRTTIAPLVRLVQDRLNARLVPLFGDDLVLFHDEVVPDKAEEAISDRESWLRSGGTINEARRDAGKEPIGPLGDIPFVSSAITPLVVSASPPDPDEPDEPDDEDGGDDGKPIDDAPDDDEKSREVERNEAKSAPQAHPPPLIETKSARAEWEKAVGGSEAPPEEDRPFERDILAALRSVADRVAEAVRPPGKAGPPPSATAIDEAMAIVAELGPTIADLAREHVSGTIRERADAAIREVGVVGISFDMANQRPASYLASASRRVGRSVTDTFRDTIRPILLEGVQEGRSAAEIARAITASIDEIGRASARRIARTELAFAHNAAQEMGWQQSGVVVGKQFVLSPDPCPWCEAVAATYGDGRGAESESRTLALGQPLYTLGSSIDGSFALPDGTTVQRRLVLDYSPSPDGDPQVPPVHPNCLLPGTLVSPGSVFAATVAVYRGNVVTVRLASGRSVTITEHHPMLGRRGFVPAALLDEGEELVCACIGESFGFEAEPNVNDAPAPIEQIVESLRISGTMTSCRMPVAAEYFHGDGAGLIGEIDVVASNRLLMGQPYFAIQHAICNSALGRRNAMAAPLARGGNLDAMLLAVRLAADGHVSGGHEAEALIGSEQRLANVHSLALISLSYADLVHVTHDYWAADTKALGECLDRLTGLVEFDKVVSIERAPYSGHVYDLSTVSGTYVANGIITHNCRCSLRPVLAP